MAFVIALNCIAILLLLFTAVHLTAEAMRRDDFPMSGWPSIVIGVGLIILGMLRHMFELGLSANNSAAAALRLEDVAGAVVAYGLIAHGVARFLSRITSKSQLKLQLREIALLQSSHAEEMTARREFIEGLNHDLRTRMQSIVAASDIISAESLSAQQAVQIYQIYSSVSSAISALSDVVEYVNLSDATFELHPKKFFINDGLSVLKQSFSTQLEAKQIAIAIKVEPSVPTRLIADSRRLCRIWHAQIATALPTVPPNSTLSLDVSMRFDTRNQPVLTASLVASRTDANAKLVQQLNEIASAEAESTAQRMDEADRKLNLAARTTRIMGGNFAIQLVEQGRLEISSSVTCRLVKDTPLSSDSKDEVIQNQFQAQSLHGTNVLIVEDDRVNRVLTTRLLEKCGCTVVAVNSGRAALVESSRVAFDIIVLDCELPDVSGLKVAAYLRRLDIKRDRYTPILALTAHSSKEMHQKCLDAGMDSFLAKPVDRDSLIEMVLRHARRRSDPTTAEAPQPTETEENYGM